MAEGYDFNYKPICGRSDDLRPNWDFQDEYTGTNPIYDMNAFPRCSTPIPNELKPQLLRNLPIGTWLFSNKSYEDFKDGLKRLPTFIVRGVKTVPRYLITGNIVTKERARRLKEPTFKQLMKLESEQLADYVQRKHYKCQKKYSFSEKQQLSPKCQTTPAPLMTYNESEFNLNPYLTPETLPVPTQEYPSVMLPPNISNMINDEDTPPFKEADYDAMEYADWTKSYESDYLNQGVSPDTDIGCKPEVEMVTPPPPNDYNHKSSSELPSRYEDLNLSDLIHRLRIRIKEDYTRKYKKTPSTENFEKYLKKYYPS